MSYPTITLEVAFTTNPLNSSPSWTDVTAYLKTVSTQRGRQRELDTFDAGHATFLLDNIDRRFDPTYTAGPYYGNLLPMRKIRLTAVVSSTTYRLWTGYVSAWQPVWDTAFTADCRVDCVDLFDILANVTLPAGTRGSELTSNRVGWVLDQAGVPAGDRTISTGQTTLPALTVTAGSEPTCLSHLLDVADSELGAFFAGTDGNAVFFNRHRVLKSPYSTSQATFGDTSDSDIPYEQLQPSYDKQLIRNKTIITRQGGTAQTTSDSTSATTYGTRVHTRSPLLTTDTEALSMGQWIVAAYKDPALRFDEVTIEPQTSDTSWTQIGLRDIWDRITVKRTPPGGGAVISQDCLIEGISHQGGRGGDGQWWQSTYRLSPAASTNFLVVSDATNGRLNFNKIAY